MDDLLQEFIAETRETAEALAGEIVAWEAAPGDRARLDAIFRFVHTVKGSCGFLDLPRLERLAHAAEDALADVRDGRRQADRALVDAVLAIVDRIGEIVDAIDSGRALDDVGEDLLIAALADEAAVEPVQNAPRAAIAAPAPRAPSRSVRLGVDLLDRMMIGMSDMVLARNELARRLRAGDVDPAIEAALDRLSATVVDMRETVTRTRMQRIDALFSALPRLVRDTAGTLGKPVALEIAGSDVELDRELIEVMRDPLVHIVRNSIDHGIEDAAARLAAGKPATGRLQVRARQAGNQIIVEVTDDGRGIDTARLIAKLAAGGRDGAALRALPERDQLALIFEPGLSSKDEATAVSGRGVGMDVVRAAIEGIGGRIEVDNAPGAGLRLAIHMPLTLSILPAIVVAIGDQQFAIPRGVIEEIVAAGGQGVRVDSIGGCSTATIRERRLPLVALGPLLGLSEGAAGMLVIVNVGAGAFVMRVDDVLDHEELVIKPAAPAVMAAGVYAGQTLPDNGRPMLLIDCAGVANVAGLNFRRTAPVAEHDADDTAEPKIALLIFRDLDGTRRAVPMAAIERIEPVGAHQIHRAAGRLRLLIDDRLIPLAVSGPIPECALTVLRIRDGTAEIGYAITEALDIADASSELAPPAEPGLIAGVALIDGEPVEVLDALWLLGGHADRAQGDARPLCLLDEAGNGWMTTFLAPMLRGAGWRIAHRGSNGETPDVVIRLDDVVGGDVPTTGAPVVHLVTDPDAAGPGAVHRYDRAGLLAAIAARRGGAR